MLLQQKALANRIDLLTKETESLTRELHSLQNYITSLEETINCVQRILKYSIPHQITYKSIFCPYNKGFNCPQQYTYFYVNNEEYKIPNLYFSKTDDVTMNKMDKGSKLHVVRVDNNNEKRHYIINLYNKTFEYYDSPDKDKSEVIIMLCPRCGKQMTTVMHFENGKNYQINQCTCTMITHRKRIHFDLVTKGETHQNNNKK